MAKLLPMQYAKILYQLINDTPVKNHTNAYKAFINLLYKDQMINTVDYIIKEYEVYEKQQKGIVTLTITTAQTVSATLIKNITKEFGKDVELTTNIDESLIGGVRVQHNNTILDASIKTQLNQLKRELT